MKSNPTDPIPMAHAKKGLSYIPLEIGIWRHPKVLPVIQEFGGKGKNVILALLFAIYSAGYYREWTPQLRLLVNTEEPTASEDLIEQVVRRLVKWGFFDRNLFEQHRVLTSRGIQRRYFMAIRKRVSMRSDASWPYLLVNAPGNTQPSPAKPQTTPAPAPAMVAPSFSEDENTRFLAAFFAPANRENLLQVCKDFGLGTSGLKKLRSLADAVMAEWALTHTAHTGYSDWSQHLISVMRIKHNAALADTPKGRRRTESSSTTSTPPSAADYSYSGGFGGQDV